MKRLNTVLSLIDGGCRLADIGCDHAYIVIEALRSGAASFAYASDIRPGPLSRARDNIAAAGLSDRVTIRLADGLSDAEGFSPDTIVIAGMGGELISRIIDEAPFVRSESIKLIIQPMTGHGKIRRYLLENGYHIYRERIAQEGKHVYQIFQASYGGDPQTYSPAELETGRDHEDTELLPQLYAKYIKKFNNIVNGRGEGSKGCGDVGAILDELKEKYENITALQKS